MAVNHKTSFSLSDEAFELLRKKAFDWRVTKVAIIEKAIALLAELDKQDLFPDNGQAVER